MGQTVELSMVTSDMERVDTLERVEDVHVPQQVSEASRNLAEAQARLDEAFRQVVEVL